MNRIFKFPNGVTLDLSNIEDEPCKVFIKGGYISRIADRLKKEENERKYNEFADIFHKGIKGSVNRNIPLNLTNMLKIENEAIKKMFKLK